MCNGVSQANAQWQLVTEDFTVTKFSSVTLSFQDDPNPALANQSLSSNISIDNASITLLSPVPEPSSLALLAVGTMSLFGFQIWRRRGPG
jgi:PEP-CTERM motif